MTNQGSAYDPAATKQLLSGLTEYSAGQPSLEPKYSESSAPRQKPSTILSTEQLEPGPLPSKSSTEQLPQLSESCSAAATWQPGLEPSSASAYDAAEPSESTSGAATWQPDPEPSSSTQGSGACDVAETGQLPQSSAAAATEPGPQTSSLTYGCESPPPFLLITSETIPFQSFSTDPEEEEEEAEGVALIAPRTASSTVDKTSAMYFSTEHESTGILLHPSPQEQNTSEELDEMKLISAFHEALSVACKAGKALQVLSGERECEINGAHLEERSECYEESNDFNKKYVELKQYEQHLKGAYEKECNLLKEQLQAMESKQKEHDRDHDIEIVQLVRKHCEEKREQQERVAFQEECFEFQSLQQKQADVSKLRKWKRLYQDGCKEEEVMCTRLAEKEKSLHTLRCQIENLEMTLKRHLLSVSEDHIKQQLQTCAQIEKMVERLPNVSGTGIDKLVGEISAQVEKMRSLSTNKRSTSWRR